MMSSEFVLSWYVVVGVSRPLVLTWSKGIVMTQHRTENLMILHSRMYAFIYSGQCMHFHTCSQLGSGSLCNSALFEFRVECAGVGTL